MSGERLVDVGVVGVEQIEEAAVLLAELVEEGGHLVAHRLLERAVEGREELGRRAGVVQLLQLQPLRGEVVGQRAGLLVGKHPLDLRREHGRVGELSQVGQPEELLVGHGGPEEVREPDGQLVVVDRDAGSAVGSRPVLLDPEEELGRDEQGLEHGTDGVVERLALRRGAVEEAEQARQVGLARGPAEGEPGEPADDTAGGLGRGEVGAGPGHEEALAGVDSLAVGGEDRVDDLLGRGEVLVDQGRRNAERRGKVVKPSCSTVVHGHPDLAGGVERNAEQVADGVVVLDPAEPPERRGAGVAAGGVAAVDILGRGPHPPHEPLAFGLRERLRVIGWRHLAGRDPRRGTLPELPAPQNVAVPLEPCEVDAPLLFLRAVTLETAQPEQGLDRRRKLAEVFRTVLLVPPHRAAAPPGDQRQSEEQASGPGAGRSVPTAVFRRSSLGGHRPSRRGDGRMDECGKCMVTSGGGGVQLFSDLRSDSAHIPPVAF